VTGQAAREQRSCSVKKPSKTSIYLFGVVTVLHALAATFLFITGRTLTGTVWAVLIAVWAGLTYQRYRIWRLRVEEFNLRGRWYLR
jgi:uncharacterized membrane protein YdbT with pleckstrin-like domain